MLTLKKSTQINEVIVDAIKQIIAAEVENNKQFIFFLKKKQTLLCKAKAKIFEYLAMKESYNFITYTQNLNEISITNGSVFHQIEKIFKNIYGYNEFKFLHNDITHMILLVLGILKRYNAFKGENILQYQHNNKYKFELQKNTDLIYNFLEKNSLFSDKKNIFSEAINVLTANIVITNTTKQEQINLLCQHHDQELINLIKQFHDVKFNILNRKWLQKKSPFVLASPNLEEPYKLRKSIETLNNKLQQKLDLLEKQENFILNDLYQKNLSLLCLDYNNRIYSSDELLRRFQEKISIRIEKISLIKQTLADIDSRINHIEEDISLFQRKLEELRRKLIIANASENLIKSQAIGNMELNYNITAIEKDLQKHRVLLQQFIAMQIKFSLRLQQLHEQFEQDKTLAMNLELNTNNKFEKYFSSLNAFDSYLDQLVCNRELHSKLFQLAKKTIFEFPKLKAIIALNLYNEKQNIDTLIQAFLILEKTKIAIQQVIQQEPTNLYLAAFKENIMMAIHQLLELLLLQPKKEIVFAFNTFTSLEQRTNFIKQFNAIELDTPIGQSLLKSLIAKIWQTITANKYNCAQNKLTQQLKNYELTTKLQNNNFLFQQLLKLQLEFDSLELQLLQEKQYLSQKTIDESKAICTNKNKELQEIETALFLLQKEQYSNLLENNSLLSDHKVQQQWLQWIHGQIKFYKTQLYLLDPEFIPCTGHYLNFKKLYADLTPFLTQTQLDFITLDLPVINKFFKMQQDLVTTTKVFNFENLETFKDTLNSETINSSTTFTLKHFPILKNFLQRPYKLPSNVVLEIPTSKTDDLIDPKFINTDLNNSSKKITLFEKIKIKLHLP